MTFKWTAALSEGTNMKPNLSDFSDPFVCVASNVPGAEGPAFDSAGRFYCVAPDRGSVLCLADKGLRELTNTGGIPAGLALGSDGNIWIADMKLGILQVHPADGTLADAVRTFAGHPVRGCNDLAFDLSSNLYFSAPEGSWETPVGQLFCRRADGEVLLLDDGFGFCNGVAVNAAGSLLMVAETRSKKIWAYDLDTRGNARHRRQFAIVPGDHVGGPDGIDFDSEGNLLVANWGGGAIEVFDPDGHLLHRIKTPFDKPSNIEIRPGTVELWITEHTTNSVWSTRWKYSAPPKIPVQL
jgi:gluconolactonase